MADERESSGVSVSGNRAYTHSGKKTPDISCFITCYNWTCTGMDESTVAKKQKIYELLRSVIKDTNKQVKEWLNKDAKHRNKQTLIMSPAHVESYLKHFYICRCFLLIQTAWHEDTHADECKYTRDHTDTCHYLHKYTISHSHHTRRNFAHS